MDHRKKTFIVVLGIVVLLVLALVIAIVLGKPGKTGSDLAPITFNLTYIPNIQFAPVYVALDQGYFADEGLDVSLYYGNEADLVALIGSGHEKFMIASGEQVLLSRAQGVPVVYVAAWYEEYPVAVAALAEKGIRQPVDLKGKDIGIPGLYGASYIGFEALRSVAQLAETDLTLNSIGYTQVEALAAKQVDAAVIYVANEPIVLASQGYTVDLIKVSDYLELVGNGLVTSENTIKTEPHLVRGMVNALLKGITFTQNSPEQAYEISKDYVENLASLDRDTQLAILKASIDLWQVDRPGYSSETGWSNMHQLLLDIGLLSRSIDYSQAYSNDFIQ